ncbi:hypothetical protein HAX54_001196, partial [Datura stramonium]|nr:hypothetical protein [Datura stramonium]
MGVKGVSRPAHWIGPCYSGQVVSMYTHARGSYFCPSSHDLQGSLEIHGVSRSAYWIGPRCSGHLTAAMVSPQRDRSPCSGTALA